MDTKELIFNMYKDQIIVSKTFKREMIKKYRLSDREIGDVYTRINNYQVKTYGGRLDYDLEYHSTEDCKKMALAGRCRHHNKINNYQKNTEQNRKLGYL